MLLYTHAKILYNFVLFNILLLALISWLVRVAPGGFPRVLPCGAARELRLTLTLSCRVRWPIRTFTSFHSTPTFIPLFLQRPQVVTEGTNDRVRINSAVCRARPSEPARPDRQDSQESSVDSWTRCTYS